MTFPPPGPVPSYYNPPIEPENYNPSNFYIQSITNSKNALIQTTTDHNYVSGQLIRFHLNKGNGMTDLNEKQAYVTSVPTSTTFTVDLDTTYYPPFVLTSFPPYRTQAQVSAIGDKNFGDLNPNGRISNSTTIPGAFINISNPQG